jgi:hypothetical protein
MTKKLDKLMTMDPKEITFEMVHKKLMEIVSTRGRRGTDRQEQVRKRAGFRALRLFDDHVGVVEGSFRAKASMK